MTSTRATAARPSPAPHAGPTLGLPAAAALVVLSSASTAALEIVVQRLVVPYVGLTLDTSTAAIGVALAGIAVGTYLGGRAADRVDPRRTIGPALVVAGVLVLLARPLALLLGPAYRGGGPSAAVLLTTVAVAAPIAVLATIPPAVVKARLADLGETGSVVGRIEALSTVGALTGTFVTGYVLLGASSTAVILGTIGTVLLVVGALVTALHRRSGARLPAGPAGLAVLVAAGALVAVPGECEYETRYYCGRVETVPTGAPTERLLRLDNLRHAVVDLADPTALSFAYTQRFAEVVDAVHPGGEPLDALHLGGGGFTMPRWLAATRPGSASTVLELDPGVVRIGRERLGLDEVPDLTVRTGDARTSLTGEPTDGHDVVIGDAFGSLSVPWHLTTVEFLTEVRRVLRPGGVYALNVIDNPPLEFVRAQTATLAAVFDHVAVLGEADQLAGDRGGNFVLVASDVPLPPQLVREGAGADWAGDAPVLTDDRAPVDQLITPVYAVRRG